MGNSLACCGQGGGSGLAGGSHAGRVAGSGCARWMQFAATHRQGPSSNRPLSAVAYACVDVGARVLAAVELLLHWVYQGCETGLSTYGCAVSIRWYNVIPACCVACLAAVWGELQGGTRKACLRGMCCDRPR